MRIRRFIPIFGLWMSAALVGQDRFPDYMEHVKFLSADEMRGRGNYEPEIDLSAEYIAEQFRRYGVEPGGPNGSYFQEFQLPPRVTLGPNQGFWIQTRKAGLVVHEGTDYQVVSYTDEKRVEGEVAFVGYGITAPEWDYDDYQNLDVEDRIVMILEEEPRAGHLAEEGGASTSPYAMTSYKLANAKAHGAAAVVLIPNLVLNRGELPETRRFAIQRSGIAAVRLHAFWAARLMAAGGVDISGLLRSMRRWQRPLSYVLPGIEFVIDFDIVETTHPVRNVIGFVPGVSDEVVVVGAHYDHVGVGPEGTLDPTKIGEIHNGADDNASGTSGLLVLAREAAAAHNRNRGRLFIAFAGEEIGLLGSRHFMEAPSLDAGRIVAMINLDMIGRSDGKLRIGGVGTALEFQPLLDVLQQQAPLTFSYSQTPTGASDHLSFSAFAIPVLFFSSGLHSDYHRPSDDWQQISVVRSEQVIEVVSGLLRSLDRMRRRPHFVDLRGIPSLMGGPESPVFGMLPDSTWASQGVRFDQILALTPAEEAGLRRGDVLIGLDGQRIDDLADFMMALAGRAAGDSVEVMILRDGDLVRSSIRLADQEDWRQRASEDTVNLPVSR